MYPQCVPLKQPRKGLVWHLLIPPRSCHDDILEGATQSGRPPWQSRSPGGAHESVWTGVGRAGGARGSRPTPSSRPRACGATRYTRSRLGEHEEAVRGRLHVGRGEAVLDGLVAPDNRRVTVQPAQAAERHRPRPADRALDRIPDTPRPDHPEGIRLWLTRDTHTAAAIT
jgi:hypothetical protein